MPPTNPPPASDSTPTPRDRCAAEGCRNARVAPGQYCAGHTPGAGDKLFKANPGIAASPPVGIPYTYATMSIGGSSMSHPTPGAGGAGEAGELALSIAQRIWLNCADADADEYEREVASMIADAIRGYAANLIAEVKRLREDNEIFRACDYTALTEGASRAELDALRAAVEKALVVIEGLEGQQAMDDDHHAPTVAEIRAALARVPAAGEKA